MIHVIGELRSYRQLARLRAAALPGVEAGLAAALGTGAARAAPGIWTVPVGDIDALDPSAAAQAALRTRDFLTARRGELFGWAVIVAELPAGGGAGGRERVQELLAEVTEDEQLWISADCAGLFDAALAMEKGGRLRKVAGRREQPGERREREEPGRWVREGLVARVLDILAPRLSGSGVREVLLLHGPAGVGKTVLLRDVSRRILGEGRVPTALRLRTIFKRRSPLHPFIGSLDPGLLAAVPRFLRGPEAGAWADTGSLLSWLREPSGTAPARRPGLLPDHVLEDFAIGYGLYLTAWIRQAGLALKPALLLCDGVDSWHPAARRLLARLLGDLLALPAFVPMLSASVAEVLPELAAIDVRTLYVHPLGKREIRSCARALFPGLELPEATARRLRRRSGGLPVSLVSTLQYLRVRGRITKAGGVWRCDGEAAAALPPSPLSVAWHLMRTLGNGAPLILYGLHLAGGLMDRQGVLAFLAGAGHDTDAADRVIGGLASLGLMEDEEALIPRYPALRRKLEDLLGAEAAGLRGRLVEHLSSLWNAGRYGHPVLLFTFLAREGRTDLALRVLPSIIRQRLDENDPAGARVFCDLRVLHFSEPPVGEHARELAAVTGLGRLRGALMESAEEAAETAAAEMRKTPLPAGREDLRGQVRVESAKHHLLRGESLASLEELKQALLSFPEGREDTAPAARACHLWLGAAMLGEGRIGEAVEYLGLSQRLCQEAGDAPGALWTSVYLADCLLLEGRSTRCLAVLDAGMETARSLYRRDIELFLRFLRARTLFQVGAYEECSLTLQACLCAATAYGVEESFPVLRAWLGRTLVHAGEPEAGSRLLESLGATREVMFFRAEAALFARASDEAARFVEAGLGIPPDARFPAPEATCWRDGFAGVEGRCHRLSRGDALVQRALAALQAYLKAKSPAAGEGIRELHQITRGGKAVDIDPSAYWHHYLYSLVLPESGEDVDDRGTIFGKALKILQERASRIDAPAQRSSFLWQSRWNRMIMEEARERKLL